MAVRSRQVQITVRESHWWLSWPFDKGMLNKQEEKALKVGWFIRP